jgi:hypothetical protein
VTKPKKSTKQSRADVLHRIWLAQANALAEILETTPVKDLNAAVLNTARQFLADQGISNDSWSEEEADKEHVNALLKDMTDLPHYDQHYE